jgi:hypothetical protein
MPPSNDRSRGEALAARLSDARRAAQQAPLRGARPLPVVNGLDQSCRSVGPLENVLAQVHQILLDTPRVYMHGNNVVLELGEGDGARLCNLATGVDVNPCAAPMLANLFVCESAARENDKPAVQFPPPSKLAALVLSREPTLAALPRIQVYARRPIFDEEFVLHGPGYDPETGILVHGIDVEPAELGDVPSGELPPHLHRLLQDFCFRSGADRANAVGAMLTGSLVTHFVETGKPVFLLDGNKPNLGKTLLARTIGMVLDGLDPELISYTSDDDEIRKAICATLREQLQSLLIFDNARNKGGAPISSPTIESNSMVARISIRILGVSENYVTPNDLLWFVTMNNTKTNADFVSRGLPIRFFYEGDPKQRAFDGRQPLNYAREHRREILAELAGMVVRWNQLGRPLGQQPHRLTHWASIIGGILDANGLGEGLTNLDEAAAEFDSEADELAALAEVAIQMNGPVVELDLNDWRANDDQEHD